ncbi:MAG: PQQ-binding-like beta-propeller repeat protein [Acidobacteria bacterium]|nr:PQQ-binding-like beta-propeller repeat protein [Acidobacteriota bacterium]
MTDDPTRRKPLRLWPGVVLVLVQWALWLLPRVAPNAAMYAILAAMACGPLILLWWLFFSRAPWVDRLGIVAVVIGAMAVTPRFLHESVAQGNMGFQFIGYGVPAVGLALVASALLGRSFSSWTRRAVMVGAILLACGVFTLLKSKGLTGDGAAEFTWRWTPTPEEQLLAQAGDEPMDTPAPRSLAAPAVEEPAPPVTEPDADEATEPPALDTEGEAPAQAALIPVEAPAAWPGFRGPDRAGVVRGVRLGTDWTTSPPVELWRRPIGPAVSSFAVKGEHVYTQEQRGEDELVACYDLESGQPVWQHRDKARFWDSHVGTGPRSTPTVRGNRVYALGATGRINALDAENGTVLWSRDATSDTDAELPTWGFVSSPLLVDDKVIVHVGALVAYDTETGEPLWKGPTHGSYGSPQLLTVDGAAQVLLLTQAGVTSVAPDDGTVLWENTWPGIGIVQPALTADGDVLISQVDQSAVPIGMRRLGVVHRADGWTVEERWTTNGLKPSFSPFVVHGDHAFGVDGRHIACIDLKTGERLWKGGRYGSGQVLLLPDQDLLLVVSEQGDLALVRAVADEFTELARVPAIEGKTWNQPALVDDVLLVRNREQMAAFRLPAAGGQGELRRLRSDGAPDGERDPPRD